MDNLSHALQKAEISLRTDANFKLFFKKKVSKIAENLNVNEQCLPHRRRGLKQAMLKMSFQQHPKIDTDAFT